MHLAILGHLLSLPISRPVAAETAPLTVLKDAGLLAERRHGTRRLYRLRPKGLAELRAFMSELWPDTLERFKAAAEASGPTSESS